MPEPDIKDAVLTRRFDLSNGGIVDIYLWAPVETMPQAGPDCFYKIAGIGSGQLRHARGIDGIQAVSLALQMIAITLYLSPEYKNGDLTWLGGRDLGLPLPPGEKPGGNEYEKADLLAVGSESAVMQIPGNRFAYVAWPGDRLEGLVGQLKDVSEKMELNDATASNALRKTINGLTGELEYFEAVCRHAGVDLAYLTPEQKARRT